MFRDEFQIDPTELSGHTEHNDKKQVSRLAVIIIAAGLFGIGASVSAVYFLSGGGATLITETLRSVTGGLPQTRELTNSANLGAALPFQLPHLARRVDTPSQELSQSQKQAVIESESASASPALESQTVLQFGKILISEAQIAGKAAGDEFMEFFNPNDFTVSLDGWSVSKKTSTGNESSLISQRHFRGQVIAPRSYFLASRSGSEIAVPPDIWWAKSNTIAKNNTLILYGKFGNDAVVVDAIGFGGGYMFEGAASPNPGAGETLSRRSIIDTDNNLADFIISISTPRNAASGPGFIVPLVAPVATPTPTPLPSPTPRFSPTQSPSPRPPPVLLPSPSPVPISSPTLMPSPSPSPLPTPIFLPDPSPSPVPISSPTPTPSPSPSPTPSPTPPPKILINEVQIGWRGQTASDFIELFNPNEEPVNLRGYRLVKRTETGVSDTSIKSWAGDDDAVIPARGFYLWANSSYATTIGILPDAITAATISPNNGIAIRFGPANTGEIIDSVGWGSAQNIFVENQVFPDEWSQNPAEQQSIQRINFQDTDNNAQDFEINFSPSPMNSASARH